MSIDLDRKTKKGSNLSGSEVRAFRKAIADASLHNDVEKAVESATNTLLVTYFDNKYGSEKGYTVTNTHPYHTDGVVSVEFDPNAAGQLDFDTDGLATRSFSVLIEAKKNLDFSNVSNAGPSNRARVICQVLYYLKNFERNAEQLPKANVIVDMDEIFVVPTKLIAGYLTQNHDWSLPPSSAADQNFSLFNTLLNDKNLNLYVERLDTENFSPLEFCDRLDALVHDNTEQQTVRINHDTLARTFDEFNKLVFGGVAFDTKGQMAVFINSLLATSGDQQDGGTGTKVFINPANKNTLLIVEKDYKGRTSYHEYPEPASPLIFNANNYNLFFMKYRKGGYTFEQQKQITEIGDILLEEFDRRFTGDYWTPEIWVDEAHRLISEELGDDWKERYVVWDAAAGSKNLTRGYKFAHLYSSTLHQEELNIAEDYNPEGVAFQYDFLNDDVDAQLAYAALKRDEERMGMTALEGMGAADTLRAHDWKLPEGLLNALKNNDPIVFFMNPPYGANGNMSEGERKTGIAQTAINKMMMSDGIAGHAAQELYTQFIYRVQSLAKAFNYTNDFHFFFFFNKGFLTSPNFGSFTNKLKKDYKFDKGFMLNAGEFNGTSSAWGIIFSGWSLDKNGTTTDPIFEVKKSVKDKTTGDAHIEKITDWVARPVAKGNTISDLIPKPVGQSLVKGSFPTTKNGFETTKGIPYGGMTKYAIGYQHNHGNNIQFSDKYIGVYSMCFNGGHGTPIEPTNFTQAAVVFSVRKSVLEQIARDKLLWVRDKDIFTKPTDEFINSENWANFVNDCVVYSLFATGSNQTSLRDYIYGTNPDGTPRKWRVDNEFFWKPKKFIKDLAVKNAQFNGADIEKDMDHDSERFVANYLAATELSPEAQRVIDIMDEVLEASFKYRHAYNATHPKYNLMTWDAGFLQLWKLCFGNDALSAAKNDPELVRLLAEFRQAREVLGNKIADAYKANTGF